MSCFLVAVLAAPAIAQDWPAFIQRLHPAIQKVTLQRIVADAQAAGLLGSVPDLVDLKNALCALRTGKDGAGAPRARRDHTGAVSGPRPPEALLVAEVEWNNAPAYAVPLGAALAATGSNADADDIDVYQWNTATDIFAAAAVTAIGGTPIVDSTLSLLAADGSLVAFNDDSGGLLSQISSLYLPAGTYYWAVGSYQGQNGGSYNLTLTTTPATVRACSATPTAGTTGTDAWTVTLASDGELDLNVVANNAQADLAIAILLTDGSLAFFNDDRTQLDPSARIGLPAGTYHVEVFDIAAGAAEPYTISCSVTAGLTDIGQAGTATGSALGEHEADLYFVDLVANQAIAFTTGDDPVSVTNIGDTIVGLYDRNFRLILEVDDTLATGYYCGQSVSLPAGTYYLQVRGFPGSVGDYQLAVTTGAPFAAAPALDVGVGNSVTTAAGAATTHRLDVVTDASHSLEMSNDYFAVIDGNGLSVIGNVERSDLVGPQVRRLAGGLHYVITYDRFASTGVRTLVVGPTDLHLDSGNDFVGHGKDQSLLVLVGDLALTTPWTVHPLVEGRLGILQPFVVGFALVGSNGTAAWYSPSPRPQLLIGADVYFQQGEFAGPNTNFAPGVVARIGGLTTLR
jgi:hypothetical protein